MSIRSQFFDSVNGDRQYDAGEFSFHLLELAFDGYIQNNDTDGMKVVASQPTNDMQVHVTPGAAFIRGRFVEVFNEAETLTIPDNNGTNVRSDRIVVRLDNNQREVLLDVLEGDAQGGLPTLTRTDQIWELSLASVVVGTGATAISQNVIADERNDLFLCGKSKPTTLRQNFQNVPGTGWFRIAETNGFFRSTEPDRYNDAFANFVIRGNDNGDRLENFNVAVAAVNGRPSLQVGGRAHGALTAFDGIRLVYDPSGADDRMALEVNVTNAATVCTFEIYDNYSNIGWFPINWTAGTVPTEFDTCHLDFTARDIVAGISTVDSPATAWSVDTNGTINANNVNARNGVNAFVLRAFDHMELLTNDKFLRGKDTAGNLQNLIGVNSFGNVAAGAQQMPFFIVSSVNPRISFPSGLADLFHSQYVQPVARITNAADQSVADATSATVAFDTARFDTDGIADLANNRLTVVTPGYYRVTFIGHWQFSAGGGFRLFSVSFNGTDTIATAQDSTASGAGSIMRMTATGIWPFGAGDYINVTAFQNSGAALNIVAADNYSPDLMMSFVSPL